MGVGVGVGNSVLTMKRNYFVFDCRRWFCGYPALVPDRDHVAAFLFPDLVPYLVGWKTPSLGHFLCPYPVMDQNCLRVRGKILPWGISTQEGQEGLQDHMNPNMGHHKALGLGGKDPRRNPYRSQSDRKDWPHRDPQRNLDPV